MKKLLLAMMLAALGLVAGAQSIRAKAGSYSLQVVSDPTVIPIGKATLVISVADSSGKPVAGAQVSGIAQMPGMPMGERDEVAVPDANHPGTYRMPAQFAMAGAYEAKIQIVGPAGPATATLSLSTGESTTAPPASAIPIVPVALALVAALLIAFILARMRKTGQRLDIRAAFSRQVVLSLLILVGLLALSVYAVNHWRRAGSMTPVEAQVMQMEMPAPEGTTPVVLATAQMKPFAPSVDYTGQAVGFVEQNVIARVSGVINWMPYYVGDRVAKGQVLARLDTSQEQPELTSKQAALSNARHGVDVARSDYQQAQAMLDEVEAELPQYQSAIDEAKANVSAARDDYSASIENRVAAQSDLANAQAALTSAQAEQTYWRQEIARMQVLLAAKAVSESEFQKDQSEGARADAAVRQAAQDIANKRAKLRAAQAAAAKSQAEIGASQEKVSEAHAQLMSHHAHVRAAQAASDEALQKISQAEAAESGAQAEVASAQTQLGYTDIRSEVGGIVTERVISPGVLVSPGQTILKVARVSPIRIQANVAEADLARIRAGNQVAIKRTYSGGRAVSARVTSVAPSVDPVSRTGVVEAVLPNRDSEFMPGEFVSMSIQVGSWGERLIVPNAAIQTAVLPSTTDVISTKSQAYVWVAAPIAGQADQFTVRRASVTLGPTAGDYTAILGGIAEGDKVVVEGATYLADGQTVSAPASNSSQAQISSELIRVTANGFEPNSVSISAGAPVTFLRTTDQTCAKEVVFPAFNIRKTLPLSVPVSIVLPRSSKGPISFVCGMNMFRGEVVIR